MVRVIYRWQVEPEQFEAFRSAWRRVTDQIHERVEGALGSALLRSCETESEVLTIAKWDSLAAWKRFWGAADPAQMQALRQHGIRLSAEAFEVIEDRTRP
ncbi:MAG: hypothetical protein Kow006_01380 [Gammaproteobacteria bacterium]